MVPENVRCTPSHEWCKVEGDCLVIGLTEYGLAPLGHLIYVELPEVGDDVLVEVPFGELEGTEDTKDLISPADGHVVEVNYRLAMNPDMLAKDPYKDGWLIRLKPDSPPNLDNLLSAADYEEMAKKRKK